ncbi:tRNA (adenosine(37)-N6)-threonylcarbamoyltransferase complex transferase subunit TsaD [Candidatus Woesebacteria bacterium]|nr:tRNA (adenosine(37)-N6)-threonylcarbamoyltransferase complex transferase subunit TsaD [Candidatus Woesebacteria bacterium]
MIILAIDTSADETSVAITEGFRVLSSTIASQIKSHNVWGGIVPSIAKLAHVERIEGVVEETIRKYKKGSFDKLRMTDKNAFDIDAIAVTYGPGLSIALEVGIRKAKELATAWGVPLLAVNHMEGHLYSPFVQNSKGNPHREVVYPFLSLLISGGHTQIVLASANGKYQIIGETVDDSAGEALDKAAKMLGLGYPGGPILERLAQDVENIDTYKFPRPMIGEKSCMMSFSGLKTHLFYFLKGEKAQCVDITTDLKYLASSFQEAVFNSVMRKFERAVNQTGVTHWAVGGGVSINKRLRLLMRSLARKHGAKVVFPPYPYLCGDNAAMIGVAAYMQAQRGEFVENIEELERIPRLKLRSQ